MQDGGGIFRSTDNGNEWVRLIKDYLMAPIIFQSHLTPITIFTLKASIQVYLNPLTTEIAGLKILNFPITKVNQFFITNKDDIYAATLNGIFLSKNGAETWDNISGNLANTQITSIIVNSEGTFYAGQIMEFISVITLNWSSLH